MARSKYVYTVCWDDEGVPLATFTVKYEAQDWAEAFCKKHGLALGDTVRYRYAHVFPWGGERMKAIICPWEER